LAVVESRSKHKLTFPKALFKITQDVPEKVPTCAQRFEDLDCEDHEPEPMEWVTVAETDSKTLHKLLPDLTRPAAVEALQHAGTILDMINEYHPSCQLDDVATLIARNGGAFVDGGPGTGKTRVLLPKILEAFRAINPEVTFIKAAPTFVAAKRMGGITCQAAVHRNVHNRFENKIMNSGRGLHGQHQSPRAHGPLEPHGSSVRLLRRLLAAAAGGRGPDDPLAHGELAHLHAALQQPPRAPDREPQGLRGLAAFPAGHEPEAS
jgi:hypothetical protein